MDIDAIVKHLDAKAKANGKPTHQCAKCVREALAAGGLVIDPHPVNAKEYGPYLEKAGFKLQDRKGYVPRKGDIVVLQNYPTGHPAGHIAMYNGQKWVSDFEQRDIWAGPGYRASKPAMQIYRA